MKDAAAPRLRAVGGALVVGAWLGLIGVQIVSGDYLPPQVSLSQYGIGPHGWIFTGWMLSMAAAVAVFAALGPPRTRTATTLLIAGITGMVVMAVVRTDANGLQQSWHARVHMAGAVLSLIALPIGLALALRLAGRRWFRAAVALCAIAAIALILLLLAAFGIDTAGGGAPAAWAFWQSVAVLTEMALLTEFAVAISRHRC